MKHQLLTTIALLIFGLTSCGDSQTTQNGDGKQSGEKEADKQPNQYEIVKENAENYVKRRMNDPDSYEFVELKLLDSVLYKDNLEYRRKWQKIGIGDDKKRLERQANYPSTSSIDSESKLKGRIAQREKILVAIDSIEATMGEQINEVASYTYLFSMRGNNKMGAKVLNELMIQTSPAPDFEMLNMTDNNDDMLPAPNQFPGYDLIQNMRENLY